MLITALPLCFKAGPKNICPGVLQPHLTDMPHRGPLFVIVRSPAQFVQVSQEARNSYPATSALAHVMRRETCLARYHYSTSPHSMHEKARNTLAREHSALQTRNCSHNTAVSSRPRASLNRLPTLRSSSGVSIPQQFWSGRRESNPRPTAWKAVTLPLSYSRPQNQLSAFSCQLPANPCSACTMQSAVSRQRFSGADDQD